jgi:Na+/melibiose symporter-like transporter
MLYDSLAEQNDTGEIQKVSGFNNAAGQLAMILGSFTGSFIASDLGLESFVRVILFTACSVAAALVTSGWLKEPATSPSQASRSSQQRLHDGFLLVRTNRSFQRILLLSVLATPFLNYLLTLFQPYFVKAKVPGIWFGITLAGASVLGILASKYAYLLDKTWGVSKGIFLATWLPGLFYLLMTWISRPPWMTVVLFIGAYGSMHLQRPIFTDYLNRHISSHNRATVLSLMSMISGIYIAGMGLIIGAIADVSLSMAFLCMGGIIVLSASVFRIHEEHVTPQEPNPA